MTTNIEVTEHEASLLKGAAWNHTSRDYIDGRYYESMMVLLCVNVNTGTRGWFYVFRDAEWGDVSSTPWVELESALLQAKLFKGERP